MSFIGTCYAKLNYISQALEYFNSAQPIYKENLKTKSLVMAHLFFNIGSCYKLLLNIKKAVDFYEMSKEIQQVLLGPKNINVGWNYLVLAEGYIELQNEEKALEYLKNAKMILESVPECHLELQKIDTKMKKCSKTEIFEKNNQTDYFKKSDRKKYFFIEPEVNDTVVQALE